MVNRHKCIKDGCIIPTLGLSGLLGMEKKIIQALKKAPIGGYSIQELSERTGLCPTTVGKYVLNLETKKIVVVRRVGMTKMVRLNNLRGEA